MMVAVSTASSQQVALGSVVPIRSVPLPAWTYLPQAERPSAVPASATAELVALAHATGALGALLRHAPGARELLPRLTDWAVSRAAAAEGVAWSGTIARTPAGDSGAIARAALGDASESADACWRQSLADWSSVTGLNAAPRKAPAWIGPSAKLASGASTVPPPPHMLKDALVSWQSAMDATPSRHDVALVRAALDAAWSMWCIHFLQPVDHSSGLLARLVAARIFASRARLPGIVIVPADGLSPLRAEDPADLAASYELWLRMSLRSMAADAQRAIAGLERAHEGRAALLDSAARMRAPRHPTMLAHAFMTRPRMTMQEAARAMGISFRAAQAVMAKFLESGLIREDTGRRRDRIYVCEGVLFEQHAQGERLPDPSVR